MSQMYAPLLPLQYGMAPPVCAAIPAGMVPEPRKRRYEFVDDSDLAAGVRRAAAPKRRRTAAPAQRQQTNAAKAAVAPAPPQLSYADIVSRSVAEAAPKPSIVPVLLSDPAIVGKERVDEATATNGPPADKAVFNESFEQPIGLWRRTDESDLKRLEKDWQWRAILNPDNSYTASGKGTISGAVGDSVCLLRSVISSCGVCGFVFGGDLCVDLGLNGIRRFADCAIKSHIIDEKNKRVLYNEYQVIKRLRRKANGFRRMPGFIDYFVDKRIGANGCEFLIMERLDCSLLDVLKRSKSLISPKTLLIFGYKMIEAVEDLHRRGATLHLDVKPGNFLIGSGPNGEVNLYLCDFGCALEFPQDNPSVRRGTVTWMSVRTHKGQSQSGYDDLESIGYVMLGLLKGLHGLPWSNLVSKYRQASDDKTRREYERQIAESKSQSVHELCAGVEGTLSLDKRLERYITALRYANTASEPNYDFYKAILVGEL
eukprot:Opistho-1_new@99643